MPARTAQSELKTLSVFEQKVQPLHIILTLMKERESEREKRTKKRKWARVIKRHMHSQGKSDRKKRRSEKRED
jgi:hypothetical protein